MGQHDDDADEGCDEIEPAHAGEKQQSAADDPEQRGRAEIGLVQGKDDGEADHGERRQHGIGP